MWAEEHMVQHWRYTASGEMKQPEHSTARHPVTLGMTPASPRSEPCKPPGMVLENPTLIPEQHSQDQF